MPKEVIKEGSGEELLVKWGSDFDGTIEVSLDRYEYFIFVEDMEEEEQELFTSLGFSIKSKKDAKRLIKALRRATKRTFD